MQTTPGAKSSWICTEDSGLNSNESVPEELIARCRRGSVRVEAHVPPDDLHLDSQLVATALEGLRQAVMEHHGTGNHIAYEGIGEEALINAEDVQVWAKTGTAQAPPLRIDSNGDGMLTEEDGRISKLDHSWVVGLVGPKSLNTPLYAIAVVIEYGGSGGRTAGPVANQIIHALQAEGYLPGDPNANTSKLPAREPATEPEDEGTN